ncbi:hypothetical protein CI105_02675 [Candidatus Izimaplasma bacterium ZiA1]|uniref:oxidoreductase n=1 Tax=Candidatus Izimoplasma sp. ZiA1 TaxID=2024899 RepID=UPI000BAA4716|nr:hypothetical protein CI105_02675 [Candidatus Izimaplasma bacterium ZiA1]
MNRKEINFVTDLSSKTIVVTGSNSGIGFESARLFASKNAIVIMAVRSIDRGQNAKDDILKEFPKANIIVMKLDLSDLKTVLDFSNELKSRNVVIDVLLNNAGIMTVPYGSTVDGYEKQIGVNHFGHFYLTHLVFDLMNKKTGRIVNVSSLAHKYGKIDFNSFKYDENIKYNKMKAYAQSKLANMLFTNKLARLLEKKNSHIIALSAHPGISRTNLGRHVKGSLFFKIFDPIINLFSQNRFMGSLPLVLASTDIDAVNGNYYGPSGIFGTKGMPKKVKNSRRSNNKELQDKFYKTSIESLKIKEGI